jgi:hypothetical protein
VDNIPTKAAVSRSTGSTSSYTQAVRWVSYCDALHNRCQKLSTVAGPRRLLDIGLNKSRFAQRVKLIETKGEKYQYVCLSHCWGATIPLCSTTTISYEDNQREIDWEKLPSTYQDTIVFARKLQIRYLWIDSLCIIQDSERDWAAESAQMAQIFQGAYLTIAATSSGDDSHGLHQEEENGLYNTHLAETTGKELGDGKIYYRRRSPHFSIRSKRPQHAEAAIKFPLLRRAWAAQERLLSTRVLHFTSTELVWECLEASGCQCLQGSDPFYTAETIEALDPKIAHATLVMPTNPLEKDEQAIAFVRWQSLVREYSRLTLTYSNDKLPALSGLAQQFHNGLPFVGDYLAGLWKADLENGLLWALHEVEIPTQRPAWRAPSWSWSSVEGQLQYPWAFELRDTSQFETSFLEILGAHTFPLHEDSYGELATASLSVLGPVVDATITYTLKAHKRSSDFKLTVSGGEGATKLLVDYAIQLPVEGQYLESGEAVRCLRVRQLDEGRVLSLVLKQVENLPLYRRIGIAEEFSRREDMIKLPFEQRHKALLDGKWPLYQGKVEVLTII